MSNSGEGHSNLTLGEYERLHVPEQFTAILLRDADLPSLYLSALSKMRNPVFREKHDDLLQRFFADLEDHSNTGLSHQIFNLVRGPEQRREISECVIRSAALFPFEELQSKAAAGERRLNEYLAESSGTPPPRGEQEEDRSDAVKAKELEPPMESDVEPPTSILGTLFVGRAFEAFKARVLCLSDPPFSIECYRETKDVDILTAFLEQHFTRVSRGQYAWISDLRDAGLHRRDIAEILHSSEYDAPWIMFDPTPSLSENWKSAGEDFHYENCPHSVGLQMLLSSEERDRLSRLRSLISESTMQPQPLVQMLDVQRHVEELCGLGGIVPDSRDVSSWNGRARLDRPDRLSISYLMDDPDHPELDMPAQIAVRLHRVSVRVLAAVALMQKSQLCCNSFTLLTAAGVEEGTTPLANLDNIHLLWVIGLEERCRKALESLDFPQQETETPELLSLGAWSNEILELLNLSDTVWSDGSSTVSRGIHKHLHVASLALQVLCVGLLSYAQSHIGYFRPFFFDDEVDEMVLLGLDSDYNPRQSYIETRFVELTCLAQMAGDVVNVLSRPDRLPRRSLLRPHDLRGTPEDILDTWGPGQVICREDSKNTPVAIALANGFIFPVRLADGAVLYHWAQKLDIQPDSPAMVMNEAIIVGAQVKVNQHCCNRTQQGSRWKKAQVYMRDLGTGDNHWELIELQIGLQAGLHVISLANATMARRPGTNIKRAKLQQAADDQDLVNFLDCLWGVRVSYCTGVAQRVLLQHLAGDLLPIIAEAETNKNRVETWNELRDKHQVFERLQDATGAENFRLWLRTLPSRLHDFLLQTIRLLLCRLANTGMTPDKRYFSVAWLTPQDLGSCIRVPIRDDHAKWLAMLDDSGDCATFAYFNNICLESDGIQCQGPSWNSISRSRCSRLRSIAQKMAASGT